MRFFMLTFLCLPVFMKAQTPGLYDQYAQLESRLQNGGDTTFVVNFWATWCKPCVSELPFFEELTQKTGGQKIKVLLISIDLKRDLDKRLLPFVQSRKLQSEVNLLADSDVNSWALRVDAQWDGAIPVTMIYNKKGKRFHKDKFADAAELASFVQSAQ